MGTRHLICVVKDGDYKVAQYGQWDGYPEGQGAEVLSFLENTFDVANLKENLSKTRWIEPEGRDKKFIDSYNKNAPEWSSDPDNRTPEELHWFETYATRDLGAKILSNIANSTDEEIIIRNSLDFSKDSLFCEWCYVIDFDKNQLEVYEGFNKKPLSKNERFYFDGEKDGEYYPVRHKQTFLLSSLPSEKEFLSLLSE